MNAEYGVVTRFWSAGRCRGCAQSHYPIRRRCPNCWNSDVEDVPILGEGVLESFTIVHRAADGRPVPYAIGWARFHSEGVRVFGPIQGVPSESIAVGQPVMMRRLDPADSGFVFSFVSARADR